MIDSLTPAVEKAVGLPFRTRPRATLRSREQVRAYILQKLDQELPASKARGLQATYRLLGLLPDSLDLRALLLDLFTEQIAGYYEPDSSMLFLVASSDPGALRVTAAHELVHALQHQYLPLDSILRQQGDNDRLTAAQAILEGQATIAGIQVMVPDQNLYAMPMFWDTYREQLKTTQSTMPVYGKAPSILRESLIFPYLGGADFLRWWYGSELHDSQPYGPRMPVSTEQILHPYRYGRGDQPVRLEFTAAEAGVIYEDVLGELDLRILIADLGGVDLQSPMALGWGGDRYRVYDTPAGAAMVWYIVWDDAASRTRFHASSVPRLEQRRRLGYRMELTPFTLQGRPATRGVIAPDHWSGWKQLATVRIPP